MKVTLLVGLVGLSVVAARPDAAWNLYQQLYPNDAMQRQALDLCFMQDPHFDRFDAAERANCYSHNAPALGVAAASAAVPINSNFVDLWRAAGRGSMPQNDVRAAQWTDRHFHPEAASRTP
jgi:hypothetical protein